MKTNGEISAPSGAAFGDWLSVVELPRGASS
jgi:hypothetical protein